MLVLSRKMQEQIRIGDNITVTILRVKGKAVSLGIDAPRTIRVLRGELSPLQKTPQPSLLSMEVESVSEVSSETSLSEENATKGRVSEEERADSGDAGTMRVANTAVVRGPLWPIFGGTDATV